MNTLKLRERVARRLYPVVFYAAESWRDQYESLWADHRRRCRCHGGYGDKCPHAEEGHSDWKVSARYGPCDCCRWCSPPRQSSDVARIFKLVPDILIRWEWPIEEER